MDKIHSRSPFYLEVDAGEPTPPSQTIPIACGGFHNVATDVGVVTYEVKTPETGIFRVDITGSNVPAKFTLKWNGNESTTNFIGSDAYDQDLLDAGVPLEEIYTGDPSTKESAFLEINKTTSQPELVELVVYGPLLNDEYTVDFTCPQPPAVIINETTQINIWFDASGSMDTTLQPLRDMAANNLKDCLVQFYNGDGDEYDKYVKVLAWGSGPEAEVYASLNERTFAVAAFEPDVQGATNVINIVFQDEAFPSYFDDNYVFNPSLQTETYRTDIANLRDKLTNYPSDYVTPIVFQVKFKGVSGALKDFLKTVENGGSLGGPYVLPNTLQDLQGQFKFYYDIEGGITYSSNPNYYRDLIIQAINDLGFSITCP